MSEITPAQAGLVKTAAIACAFTELVDPHTLKPHPLNPNKHPPKQIEMYQAILAFQGWRRAITVSRRSGFMTRGHGALEAALLAGYAQVPVDFQDYSSDEQELADLVADNQLPRMSEVQKLLTGLNTGEFNMELTGLETGKLEKLLATTEAPKLMGGAGAPTGAALTGQGAPQPGGPMPSQVRMVQLFFNTESHTEFTTIADYFQKELGTENLTDTVLSIMKSAFDGHTETGAAPSGDADPS